MTTETEEKILDFMEKLYLKTEADKKQLMKEIRRSRYEAKSDLAEFKQEMAEFKQEITAEVKDLSYQMKEVHIVLADHSTQLKEINGKVDQLIIQQKRSDERILWLERRTANS